jgi:opacity protein-like surface antigen
MKIFITAVIAIALCTAPAAAQVSLGFNIYGGGGLSTPTTDLSDLCKSGYHGMAGLGFSPVPMLETVARFGYHSFPFKEDDDENFTISEYGLDVRANLAAPGLKFRPYALIGAGVAKYNFSQDIFDIISGTLGDLGSLEPKTKFFYCFGGGIKVNALPKLNFFLEGRYCKISVTEGNLDYIPITGGLNISL